jgi:hypothetical protein
VAFLEAMARQAATMQTEGAMIALSTDDHVTVYQGGTFDVAQMLYALQFTAHQLLDNAMHEARNPD